MSELIAEARVLVTPDTTAFRAQLEAQLAAATKGIVVPIPVTAVSAGGTTAAGVQQELAAGAALAAGNVNKATSEIEGFTAAEQTAAKVTKEHAKDLGNLSRGAGATGLSFLGLRGATLAASGAFVAGAAGAIAFSKAIGLAAQFQTQLNTFQVVVGATADEMHRVGDEAKALGQDISLPGVSAADAAQAFTELSKAGLSVQDSLDGARGVLQLATAAGIDNAAATELAASALNAFGLAGDQAVHVADVLANSANDAQGSISDIGIALQQASAAGRQAGLSLEQTTAILTEFARNGIKGSDAGTLLRTLLIRLINPTTKAAAVIKQLGLNVRDATGAIDVNVFQQFADATAKLTPAARDQAAAIIAGQDAFRGLSILAREGGDALDAQVGSLNKSGTAAEVAGAKMKGLAGDASALQSNLETLGISIGTVLIPALGTLARGANIIVTGFQKASDAVKAFNDLISGGSFDAANANLDELATHLADLSSQADDFRRSNDQGFLPPSLTQDQADLAKQITAIGKSLVGTQAGFQKFVSIVSAASPAVKAAMEDNVITPIERAQLQSSALGRAFVAALPKSAFVGLGAGIRSGIEDATAAAKVGVADLGAEIHSGIEDASRQAVVDARTLGSNVAAAVSDGFAAAARSARLAAGSAASNIIDLQFRGASPQQQLAGLQKQLDAQTDLVDVLTKRGAPQAKIDQAKEDAIATQKQIDGIQATIDQATQDTINKAKDAASARASAAQAAAAQIAKDDQKVLDSFIPAQNRIDLQAITANGTARLSDNLKLQDAIIAEAEREVKIITDTVKDVKTKNAALAQQARIIKAAQLERDSIIEQIAQTATENRKKAADAITATLGQRIQLAELRGNDQAEVSAINKAIADEKRRIANFKKLGLNLLDEKIALQELINKRNDLKNTAKDAADSTSAFELLKQAAETFTSNAGNLVGGNQPFAGPTGFTADIAQFLKRQQPTTAKQVLTPPSAIPVNLQDQALIQAIDKLRETIEGKGLVDTSSAAEGGPLSQRAVRAARFHAAVEARNLELARGNI